MGTEEFCQYLKSGILGVVGIPIGAMVAGGIFGNPLWPDPAPILHVVEMPPRPYERLCSRSFHLGHEVLHLAMKKVVGLSAVGAFGNAAPKGGTDG